jgi:hypothetical protein
VTAVNWVALAFTVAGVAYGRWQRRRGYTAGYRAGLDAPRSMAELARATPTKLLGPFSR